MEQAFTKIVRASLVVPLIGPPIADGAVAFTTRAAASSSSLSRYAGGGRGWGHLQRHEPPPNPPPDYRERASESADGECGCPTFTAGRVVAVGRADSILANHPAASVEDLGDAVLLPGLVNPHTHLELSLCEPAEVPASFIDWILALRGRSQLDGTDDPTVVAKAMKRGIDECLHFGVTTVGDISRLATLTRAELANSPLTAVSFGEVLAIAKFRGRADTQISAATDQTHATDRLTPGITPHAAYTVEPAVVRRCLMEADRHHLPLAMHVAEQPEEDAFLSQAAGPFRKLLDQLGQWDDLVPRFVGGPIRFAASLGLLDRPTLLAHVNYCDDAELAILAAGRASVVYCPRTHTHFGHPPHRWQEMLAAGINVAIGTDSRASSPDLNLLDDLRLVHRLAPDRPVEQLWQMVGPKAAQAIGLESQVGSLSPGKQADFVAFDADSLEQILDEPQLPMGVWIAGEKIAASAN